MTIELEKDDSITILLVEDNPAHAEITMRGLENNRIANIIHHVSDGEQALDYLFQRKDYSDTVKYPLPSLILLDLRLPKVDGQEVLEKIKTSEQLMNIPVVILTTSAAEIDVVRAYKYHANSYLVKPIDFKKFSDLMNDMGYYWLAWNHRPFIKPEPD
jgi:CheY-like chemotaxis protein